MKMIIIADANSEERQELWQVLERSHYHAASTSSLAELLTHIRENSCYAVILDLDSLPVDNRFIRGLCKENPDLHVIGISSRTFHPELEEAMRTYISACLSKPVDPDELIYWLKSLCEGEPGPRASPEGERD
jgi:DNA-binding NtrC family response regulator